jgi:hypothetical protein
MQPAIGLPTHPVANVMRQEAPAPMDIALHDTGIERPPPPRHAGSTDHGVVDLHRHRSNGVDVILSPQSSVTTLDL